MSPNGSVSKSGCPEKINKSLLPPGTGSSGLRDPLGISGEALAERWLMSSGCRILARRWRPRGMNLGELDLVAMDRGEVVFVEVKTRRSDAFGAPEEAATPEKLGKVIRTAQAFLAAHPRLRRLSWRLDVIAVEWRDDRPLLRHYKGVGEAG